MNSSLYMKILFFFKAAIFCIVFFLIIQPILQFRIPSPNKSYLNDNLQNSVEEIRDGSENLTNHNDEKLEIIENNTEDHRQINFESIEYLRSSKQKIQNFKTLNRLQYNDKDYKKVLDSSAEDSKNNNFIGLAKYMGFKSGLDQEKNIKNLQSQLFNKLSIKDSREDENPRKKQKLTENDINEEKNHIGVKLRILNSEKSMDVYDSSPNEVYDKEQKDVDENKIKKHLNKRETKNNEKISIEHEIFRFSESEKSDFNLIIEKIKNINGFLEINKSYREESDDSIKAMESLTKLLKSFTNKLLPEDIEFEINISYPKFFQEWFSVSRFYGDPYYSCFDKNMTFLIKQKNDNSVKTLEGIAQLTKKDEDEGKYNSVDDFILFGYGYRNGNFIMVTRKEPEEAWIGIFSKESNLTKRKEECNQKFDQIEAHQIQNKNFSSSVNLMSNDLSGGSSSIVGHMDQNLKYIWGFGFFLLILINI